MAYWGDADARALDLIDSARGFADRRDFVFLVLNTGDTAEALVTALRDHIRGQVNSGVPDQFFRVLETDAADTGGRLRPRAVPGAGPPRRADARDGRRHPRGHPGRAARHGAADRDARGRPGAGARVGGAGVGQRRRGPRPAVAAAAPGPVRRAGRAGVASCARRPARSARTRTTPTPSSARTPPPGPGSRDGLGVGEQAWRDEALRSMTVDRNSSRYAGRRAQPGPGGDQQLLRGDRRLLRRAGAGAVGARRARSSASTPARSWARRAARTRCAGSPRCWPRRPSRARGCAGPSSSCSPCGWTTAPSCTRGCAPSSTA